MSIKATGNGSASYAGTSVRDNISSFTVIEGSSATITFAPDEGYLIKSVKVGGTDVTTGVSNNQYTISNINADMSLEVVFEAIPPTTYTLSIKATGNGSVIYEGASVCQTTCSYKVTKGSTIKISIEPDNGFWTKSLFVNSEEVTSNIISKTYIIDHCYNDIVIEVVFAEDFTSINDNGISYVVSSYDNKSIVINKVLTNGKVLEIPAKVYYQDVIWEVSGIENDALNANKELAAIIWNPDAVFNATVNNPNVLLYVKSEDYATETIKNVIVNNTAEQIVLTDASSENDFYCPREFTARTIKYTHYYGMSTNIDESKGWDTIVLPFDVQKVEHSTKGEIVPYLNWKSGDTKKPFMLMEFGTNGWQQANSIKANIPYIISMPNHSNINSEFRLDGNISFISNNIVVQSTDGVLSITKGDKSFTPNYSNQNNALYYTLNVNNEISSYNGEFPEGSRFILNLRSVHPFEAYMTCNSNSTYSISIEDDMTTGVDNSVVLNRKDKRVNVYNIQGQLVKVASSQEDAMKELPAGVYIINSKKLIIK